MILGLNKGGCYLMVWQMNLAMTLGLIIGVNFFPWIVGHTDEFYQNGYYGDANKERKLEYDRLMKFIENAKTAISEGDAIYYSNWE